MSDASAVVEARVAVLHAGLRARGVRCGVGELLTAHRALAAVDAARRDECEAALRAVLCSRHEDLAAFDAAFRDAFGKRAGLAGDDALAELRGASAALPRIANPDAEDGGGGDDETVFEPTPVPAAWSEIELLRDRDVATLTPDEARRVEAAVTRLAVRGPFRPSRRRHASRRRGGPLDVRATVALATRTSGVPLERRWRATTPVQRPLVLLLDVSGSMAPYARMLLLLAHAAVRSRPGTEVFAFGTRLTRLTLELRHGDPDAALARAHEAAQDWAAGTRIGEALATLNRDHGRRLGRGAVVVVLSDGWDRGAPEVLAAEMARLRRCAHRVLWLNPLKAAPGYEPLARGMAAALPHTDAFLSGHSLRALEELVDLLDEGLAA